MSVLKPSTLAILRQYGKARPSLFSAGAAAAWYADHTIGDYIIHKRTDGKLAVQQQSTGKFVAVCNTESEAMRYAASK